MSSKTSVTLSVAAALLAKMADFYSDNLLSSPGPYILFQARSEGVTITAYAPKKGLAKVLFQGKGALEEARIWGGATAAEAVPEAKAPRRAYNSYPQIGSDEVGTGDYFGPVCVVAAYVEEKDLPRLRELGITDSKKMGDAYILQIGPTLIKEFPYSQLCLDNPKYNKLRQEGINMNEVKAKMHNAVLLNLVKRFPQAHIYQDQFAESGIYYRYLRAEKEVVSGISFKTKGESAFPSVALASVLARYSFLKHMAALEKRIGEKIPLGAGPAVDAFARSYCEKHGLQALDDISKTNWGNRKRLLEGK